MEENTKATVMTKLPGCFGCEDKVFAGHPCDELRASELLTLCVKEGLALSDVKECATEYLQHALENKKHTKQEAITAHINEQLDEIEKRFSPWLE